MKWLLGFWLTPVFILGLAGNAIAQEKDRMTLGLGVTYVGDNDTYKNLLAVNARVGATGNWWAVSMRSELSGHLFNVGDQYEIGRPLFRIGVGNFFGLGRELRHAYFLTTTSEMKGFYLNLRYGEINGENIEEGHKYVDFTLGKKF